MGRYALILSGQPRYRQGVVELLLQNIVLPNNCDVFGFFWIYQDEDTVKKNIWPDIPNKDVIQRDITVVTQWRNNVHAIASILPFTKLAVCNQIPFSDTRFGPGTMDLPALDVLGQEVFDQSMKRWNISVQSQFYGVWAVGQLLQEYEKEHNFRYDGVFRIRTDILIENPIYFDTMDASKLNLYMKDEGKSHFDFCAYGNSDFMKIYCDYYHHLDWIYSEPYDELSCCEKHLLKYFDHYLPKGKKDIIHNNFGCTKGLEIIY
jgi:hypothetical protein